MKRLVIIQDVLEARSFSRQYRKSPDWQANELVLFTPDPESFRFFQSVPELSPVEASAFDDTSRQSNVTATAYDLASRWTRLTGRDSPYIYRGVSLSLAVQREMTYFWVGLLRSIHIFNELLRQEEPDEIWLSESSREDLFFYAPSNYLQYSGIASASSKTKDKIRRFKLGFKETSLFMGESILRKVLFLCGGYWTHQALKRTPRFEPSQLTSVFKDAVTVTAALVFRFYQRYFFSSDHEAILVSSSLSHIKPVIKVLKANSSLRIDYLREVFGPRQATRMKKEGIVFRSFTKSAQGRHKKPESQFLEIPDKHWGSEEFEGCELVKVSRPKLNFLISRYFPQVARLCDSAHSFLNTHTYIGLAGEEDVCVFNKVLFEVARQKGIRSVVAQHGAAGLRIGFVPLSATYFAAWGNFARDRLLSWGVSEDRVVVTGNPAYDGLAGEQTGTRTAHLAQRYGIKSGETAVLVAMFPFRDYSSTDFPEVSFSRESYVDSLKEIIEGLKPFNQHRVILKLHPRDSGFKKCEEIINAAGAGNIVLVKEGSILDWAPLCRAAVSFFSSSVMDLIACRTPLVMLDITGNVERTRSVFPVDIPIIPARSEALSRALGPILSGEVNPLDEAAIYKYIYKLDGKAALRIAALLCADKEAAKSSALDVPCMET